MTTAAIAVAGCAPDLGAPADELPATANEDGFSVDGEGVMHFASADTFFATISKVAEMSPAALDAWEEARGFVSHRRSFERAMREVAAAASPQAADELLRVNADVISLTGEHARPSIESSGYGSVASRSGLFYVAGTLHKVAGDIIISTADGELATIERALAALKGGSFALTESAALVAPGVRAMRYVVKDPGGEEGTLGTCAAQYNGALSVSDRRVEVSLNANIYYASDCQNMPGCNRYETRYGVELVARGYKKLLGSWRSYDTSYSYDGFEFSSIYPYVTGSHIGPGGVEVSDFAYSSGVFSIGSSTSSSDASSWRWIWFFGSTLINASPVPWSFDKLKVRTKSRGTGEGGWVKFCCNYPELYDCGFSSPPPPPPPPPPPGGGGECLGPAGGSSESPSLLPTCPE